MEQHLLHMRVDRDFRRGEGEGVVLEDLGMGQRMRRRFKINVVRRSPDAILIQY